MREGQKRNKADASDWTSSSRAEQQTFSAAINAHLWLLEEFASITHHRASEVDLKKT